MILNIFLYGLILIFFLGIFLGYKIGYTTLHKRILDDILKTVNRKDIYLPNTVGQNFDRIMGIKQEIEKITKKYKDGKLNKDEIKRFIIPIKK